MRPVVGAPTMSLVSGVAFLAGDAASQSTTADAVSWSQVIVGVLLLVLGVNLVSKGVPPLT